MRWLGLAAGTALLFASWAAPAQETAGATPPDHARFVTNNALFVLAHELGHAAISEFNLPVLGREEDAADTFAVLSMLFIGSDQARAVLSDAAAGLYAAGERAAREGRAPDFFGEHGLDKQRAAQIVCLMVGARTQGEAEVALAGRLPADRRESCVADYEQAEDAWMRLLRRHMRASGAPSFFERLLKLGGRDSAAIEVIYAPAPEDGRTRRDAFVATRALERLRDFARDNFSFPRPLIFEAKTCGRPDASWDPTARRLEFCYELLDDLDALAKEVSR